MNDVTTIVWHTLVIAKSFAALFYQNIVALQ